MCPVEALVGAPWGVVTLRSESELAGDAARGLYGEIFLPFPPVRLRAAGISRGSGGGSGGNLLAIRLILRPSSAFPG